MARLVLAGDSHRPVDLGAQLAAIVPKRLGQRRDVRWPTLGLLEKGLDEPVARRPGCEHHVPRLDVGVRRRVLGQDESLLDQCPRHRLGQKQPRRMAVSDHLLKVEHGDSLLPIGQNKCQAIRVSRIHWVVASNRPVS